MAVYFNRSVWILHIKRAVQPYNNTASIILYIQDFNVKQVVSLVKEAADSKI